MRTIYLRKQLKIVRLGLAIFMAITLPVHGLHSKLSAQYIFSDITITPENNNLTYFIIAGPTSQILNFPVKTARNVLTDLEKDYTSAANAADGIMVEIALLGIGKVYSVGKRFVVVGRPGQIGKNTKLTPEDVKRLEELIRGAGGSKKTIANSFPRTKFQGPPNGWPNNKISEDIAEGIANNQYWGKRKHMSLDKNRLKGLLVDAQGKPLNGEYIYAIDRDGSIYFNKPIQRHLHHSSLLGGENCYGAGQMQIRNGRIKTMDDASGHYHSTQNDFHLDKFKNHLRDILKSKRINKVNDIHFKAYGKR